MTVSNGVPASFTVPAAMLRYGNIILKERPVHDGDVFSRRHPKMTQLNRAKIFAPFAALVGFEERVHRKEITYVSKHELDAEEEWNLNQKLLKLHSLVANSRLARANMVTASVEFFEICVDEENNAYQTKGLYRTVRGIVLKVDQPEQNLTIRSENGKHVIPFTDIYRIDLSR